MYALEKTCKISFGSAFYLICLRLYKFRFFKNNGEQLPELIIACDIYEP